MNDIRNVFAAFWGSYVNRGASLPNLPTGAYIPAFAEGYVPREHKDTWPRITYQIALTNFLDSSILAASIWDRRAAMVGFFGLIDDVIEQAREKIPESGTVLRWDGGALWVMRSTPFIDFLDDPEDQSVIRGIIRTVVRSHIA